MGNPRYINSAGMVQIYSENTSQKGVLENVPRKNMLHSPMLEKKGADSRAPKLQKHIYTNQTEWYREHPKVIKNTSPNACNTG